MPSVLTHPHSYAKQVLQEKGDRIQEMIDGLDYTGLYTQRFIPPSMKVIPILARQRDIRRINSYDDLRKHGFKVGHRSPKKKKTNLQRVEYFLARADDPRAEDYGSIPMGHHIDYDFTEKEARIIGTNSFSNWIRLSDTVETPKNQREANSMLQAKRIYEAYSPFKTIDDPLIIDIPEVPVLVTPNEIVCLPIMADEFTIGIFGQKGKGKSTLLNSIFSWQHHHGKKRCINMNDKLVETGPWALPWNPKTPNRFIGILSQLNTKPMPLPIVNLHLQTNPPVVEFVNKDEVAYLWSLSFQKFILDFENFTKGYKRWEFKNSGTWFRNLLYTAGKLDERVPNAKDMDEFIGLVEEKIPGKQEATIRNKITNVVHDIYNQGFLNIANNINPNWQYYNRANEMTEYAPWIACLAANICPIIETGHIKEKQWFPQVERYIGQTIINAQKEGYFKKNEIRIWAFADELSGIIYDRKRQPTAAYDVFVEMVTEGRPLRIGFVYATQDFRHLPDRIQSNTNFGFVFAQTSENAKAIARDYDLDKTWVARMLHLKAHEAIAVTKVKYICYDIHTGERREEEEEPLQGIAVPPLNQQQIPAQV